MRAKTMVLISAAAVIGLVAALSDVPTTVNSPRVAEPSSPPTESQPAAMSRFAYDIPGITSMIKEVSIDSRAFVGEWPFTQQRYTVHCEEPFWLLIAEDGTAYALNGTAKGRARRYGWREIDAVWRDNPQIEGAKVSLAPIQALC